RCGSWRIWVSMRGGLKGLMSIAEPLSETLQHALDCAPAPSSGPHDLADLVALDPHPHDLSVDRRKVLDLVLDQHQQEVERGLVVGEVSGQEFAADGLSDVALGCPVEI